VLGSEKSRDEGCEPLYTIKSLAGKEAAERALIFCWYFRCVNLTWLADFLSRLYAASSRRVDWSRNGTPLDRMRANVLSVLSVQFGPTHNTQMPQTGSMSLLGTLDGFCQANCPQHLISYFFKYMGRVVNECYQIAGSDVLDLINMLRFLREHMEWTINNKSDEEKDCATEQARRLQSQLCYLEAGLYKVSGMDCIQGRYEFGIRKSLDIVEKGIFVHEANSLVLAEASGWCCVNMVAHDQAMTWVFDQWESSFGTLYIQPMEKIRKNALLNKKELGFEDKKTQDMLWRDIKKNQSQQKKLWQQKLKEPRECFEESKEIDSDLGFDIEKKHVLLGGHTEGMQTCAAKPETWKDSCQKWLQPCVLPLKQSLFCCLGHKSDRLSSQELITSAPCYAQTTSALQEQHPLERAQVIERGYRVPSRSS
jgi:hypothetical protein